MAVEICEDLWSVIPPSSNHSLAGATIIANPSAGNEITGKDSYRLSLVSSQSAKTISSYIYTCAGYGESTTDVVFSGHNIICENGTVLATAKRFENGIVYGDVDVFKIASERQKIPLSDLTQLVILMLILNLKKIMGKLIDFSTLTHLYQVIYRLEIRDVMKYLTFRL